MSDDNVVSPADGPASPETQRINDLRSLRLDLETPEGLREHFNLRSKLLNLNTEEGRLTLAAIERAEKWQQERRDNEDPGEWEYEQLSKTPYEDLQGPRLATNYLLKKVRGMLQNILYFHYSTSVDVPLVLSHLSIRLEGLQRARAAIPALISGIPFLGLGPDDVPETFLRPIDDLDRSFRDALASETISLSECTQHFSVTPLHHTWFHDYMGRGRVGRMLSGALYDEAKNCKSKKHEHRNFYSLRCVLAHHYWIDPHPNPVHRRIREYDPSEHWAAMCHAVPPVFHALTEQMRLLDRIERDIETGVLDKQPPRPEPTGSGDWGDDTGAVDDLNDPAAADALDHPSMPNFEEGLYWPNGKSIFGAQFYSVKEPDAEENADEEDYYEDGYDEEDYEGDYDGHYDDGNDDQNADAWPAEDEEEFLELTTAPTDDAGNCLDDDGNVIAFGPSADDIEVVDDDNDSDAGSIIIRPELAQRLR